LCAVWLLEVLVPETMLVVTVILDMEGDRHRPMHDTEEVHPLKV
jgi:hypothetical protein